MVHKYLIIISILYYNNTSWYIFILNRKHIIYISNKIDRVFEFFTEIVCNLFCMV